MSEQTFVVVSGKFSTPTKKPKLFKKDEYVRSELPLDKMFPGQLQLVRVDQAKNVEKLKSDGNLASTPDELPGFLENFKEMTDYENPRGKKVRLFTDGELFLIVRRTDCELIQQCANMDEVNAYMKKEPKADKKKDKPKKPKS